VTVTDALLDDDLGPAPPDVARRREVMAKWRKRSRLIHGARRALPAAIGAILLGLLLAVIVTAVMGQVGEQRNDDGVIRMINPRFYGRQSDGSAFMLSAKEAARDRREATRIELRAPEIVLNSEDARTTRINAQTGLYDERTKMLRLSGGVIVAEPQGGMRFQTEEAVVDTQSNLVVGSRPVQGVAPTGQIAANSYAIYDQGARIVFRGAVRARLKQGAGAAEGASR
jgi:lipopolysaccharide export system protein LptC